MKKLFAILLTVAMLASMATVVSAASTTTLTTTVPAASYTLNIPANQQISFGETSTDIGSLSVTNASGFATGKNLKVSITYDAFKCSETTTTIPFVPVVCVTGNTHIGYEITSGESVTFIGLDDGSVNEYVMSNSSPQMELDSVSIEMNSSDWGKALAGNYTATITFTAEVVVE